MTSTRPHARLSGLLPALLATCLLSPAWATASPVWRCESGGRVTYADQPCPKALGTSEAAVTAQHSVAADDPRTAEQRREGQWVAKLDERLLARLQQERQLRERQAPQPAGAAIIGLPPDPLATPLTRPALRPTAKDARSHPKPPAPQGGPSGARTSPAAGPASPRAAG